MEDATHYASGNWHVKAGSEDQFLARWREFLEWTRDNAAGFQHAFLLRAGGNPRHFESFSTWDSQASQHQWRTLPDFAAKLEACQAVCDQFENDAYERVISIR